MGMPEVCLTRRITAIVKQGLLGEDANADYRVATKNGKIARSGYFRPNARKGAVLANESDSKVEAISIDGKLGYHLAKLFPGRSSTNSART